MIHREKLFATIVPLLLAAVLFVSGCTVKTPETATSAPTEQPAPTAQPVSTEQPGMPNPASVYCEEQGGVVEIRTAEDGSQSGACIFPDGNECDEWAFFRKECYPAGDTVVNPVIITPAPALENSPSPVPYAVFVKTSDGRGVVLLDRSGQVLGEWQMLQPGWGSLHAAAPVTGDVNSVPLVFTGIANDIPGLKVNLGGEITDLFDFAPEWTFTGLIGVPASPIMAYSTLQPTQDGSALRSTITVGNYQELGSIEPVLTVENSESQYAVPVGIKVENNQPVGLWYTYQLWGIGGDIFTNESHGLYYMDLVSVNNYEYLPADRKLNDLSVDQSWAAWTPQLPDANMTITHLNSHKSNSFEFMAGGERGAVRAFISPAAGYAAWMEGSGWEYDNTLQVTIRVGAIGLDSLILGEYPTSAFAGVSGLGDGQLVVPLGWLDDQSLLVQAFEPGAEGNGAILRLDVSSGEIAFFAPGGFAGFAYP